jgi:hypothetical protein
MFERRCPQCGSAGAHKYAEACASCGVPLESREIQIPDEPPKVVLYRPWVVWVMAVIAIAFPFLPIPFVDGIAGFGLKLMVSVALVKAIRDYREGMK